MICFDNLSTKNPYKKYYSDSYTNNYLTDCISSKWTETLRSRLAIPYSPRKKILDVACGTGMLGKILSDNVYGFDLSQEAVEIAKKNGINVQLGDVERKWNFPDNYFDTVIASHIIEHMVNPDHLLLEAKRVLKKDGLLIIATPNLAAWFNRILLLLGYQPFFTEVSTLDKTLGLKFTRKFTNLRNPLGHLRLFTCRSLKDILELHGFEITKISGAEFLAFPPLLLFIDKMFTHLTPFASNIIVVAKKL